MSATRMTKKGCYWNDRRRRLLRWQGGATCMTVLVNLELFAFFLLKFGLCKKSNEAKYGRQKISAFYAASPINNIFIVV
ncbi:hypothetical protein [Wolbachia endosymbiont (group A) of Lasioglossum morio]|uniref:hypothetical protein n=1 Tax=Wolbachia endosymbiont (group A) of Lasioglossum morio TaxID=2954025 RepID=UPI002226D6D0|nr:hypothetical protein [Wolbachia endosymbiont (group A) of Lasioglossum morio]